MELKVSAPPPPPPTPTMMPARKRGRPRKHVATTTSRPHPAVAQTTSKNNNNMNSTTSDRHIVPPTDNFSLKPAFAPSSYSRQSLDVPKTPTKSLQHSTPLSSSPPNDVIIISAGNDSEEEVDIFVDPRSQSSPPASQPQKNVLEEIPMPPPPLQPQTPIRSHTTYQPFPTLLNSRSHVDPSVLFNNATNGFNGLSVQGLSSSPPKSSSSYFCSSPSTPKTFSNIIHSSPLYPGFRSSPVHGTSPSSLPHLVPFAPGSKYPHIQAKGSRRVKGIDGLPKLGFEALAKARQRKLKKKRRKSFGSRFKSSPEKSLYHRRRNFLNSRRDRNLTASSPIFPGSPKFGDALHFSPKALHGDAPRGLGIIDLGSLRIPLPKPRRISLSVDTEGRAIIDQEFSPVKHTCQAPTEVLDRRYESSEEEDEDYEESYESESGVENSPTPRKARSILSTSTAFSESIPFLAPPFSHKPQLPNETPNSVSSLSPFTDRAPMQSPTSSPLHSPLAFGRFLRTPSKLSKRQNLDDVFPELNSPRVSATPGNRIKSKNLLNSQIEDKTEEKISAPKCLNAREAFAQALQGKNGAENKQLAQTPPRKFAASFSSGLGLGQPKSNLGHLLSASTSPTFEDFMFEGYEDWTESPSKF